MPRGTWLWLFECVVKEIHRFTFLDHKVTVSGGVYESAGHGKNIEMIFHFFLQYSLKEGRGKGKEEEGGRVSWAKVRYIGQIKAG